MPSEELDVFLSSDINEFKTERERLSKVICKIPFCSCIPLERRGAEATDVLAASLKAARDCDVYVGVFGRNYSETTIKEYKEAVKHHKACLCYVRKVSTRDSALTKFVGNELATQFKYHEFKGRKDMYTQVTSDLKKLIFETLKDGLRYRKGEKAKAIELIAAERKSIFTVTSTVESTLEAQRAYDEEKYLECIVQASIALERALREKLRDKNAQAKRMSLGQLIRLAVDTGIVHKDMAGALLETSYVRNAVVHGMQTPNKKTALWILQTVKEVVASFKE
jgi:hypothetical protein